MGLSIEPSMGTLLRGARVQRRQRPHREVTCAWCGSFASPPCASGHHQSRTSASPSSAPLHLLLSSTCIHQQSRFPSPRSVQIATSLSLIARRGLFKGPSSWLSPSHTVQTTWVTWVIITRLPQPPRPSAGGSFVHEAHPIRVIGRPPQAAASSSAPPGGAAPPVPPGPGASTSVRHEPTTRGSFLASPSVTSPSDASGRYHSGRLTSHSGHSFYLTVGLSLLTSPCPRRRANASNRTHHPEWCAFLRHTGGVLLPGMEQCWCLL